MFIINLQTYITSFSFVIKYYALYYYMYPVINLGTIRAARTSGSLFIIVLLINYNTMEFKLFIYSFLNPYSVGPIKKISLFNLKKVVLL